MPKRNEADDAARLAPLARAHGFILQRRGLIYFVTEGSELGCTGNLEKVESWLAKALHERRPAVDTS